MSGCIRGREVVVAIRKKRTEDPTTFRIIIPARWTKADLLRYVRAEHPGETVRLAQWLPCGNEGDPWRQRLWMANPAGFVEFVRAR